MNTSKVIYNRRIGDGYYRMGITWSGRAVRSIKGGHFIMLKVSGGLDPLLRRPFSVCEVIDKAGGGPGIDLLYKVVGRGTEMMAALSEGDSVDILGPLGNHFPKPAKGSKGSKKVIMVGGGIGLAPFFLFSRLLSGAATSPTLIFGGRSKRDVEIAREIKDKSKYDIKLKITTEDGTVGTKGLVTDVLKDELTPDSVVYGCGPNPMLRAVYEMAREAGVKSYLSMERRMACGMGACLGCALEAAEPETDYERYKMVCSDGPVFEGGEIDWESL